MLQQILTLWPEITLTLLAIFMQLVAVFYPHGGRVNANTTVILAVALIGMMSLYNPGEEAAVFNNSFVINGSLKLAKIAILIFAVSALLVYRDFCNIAETVIKQEFITLVLLSTVGVFLSVSANNFLVLFAALELQALAAYALASFDRQSPKAAEAGLKYFVLGALISAISLFGISFIYGFNGSLQFESILEELDNRNIGLIIGVVLMLGSILFKLSASPLHIWTPDVYEGAPITSVTYFATVQKIGMVVVLFNLMFKAVGGYSQISVDLIKITAVLSMLIGSLGAIGQFSLKRLMAYSTILNIGYVLIGIALHSDEGTYAAFLYVIIYAVSILGFFACLVALLGKLADDATFESIKGVASSRKTLAAAIAVIMFSMIGLPPLAGFFGKYYIFYQAIVQGEMMLAVIGILTSVIAAYYYLKIVMAMYFIDSPQEVERIPTRSGLFLVTTASVIFILLLFMVL